MSGPGTRELIASAEEVYVLSVWVPVFLGVWSSNSSATIGEADSEFGSMSGEASTLESSLIRLFSMLQRKYTLKGNARVIQLYLDARENQIRTKSMMWACEIWLHREPAETRGFPVDCSAETGKFIRQNLHFLRTHDTNIYAIHASYSNDYLAELWKGKLL